ncbi:ZP domain-containing protein [Trichostrongylus colubriformis]|uniref:ZP domain-containing protein n=1 Tax=Trichostrongylus colubriformis TaxID=6319 RepID=A0AAN8J141_TRICO
MSSRYVGYDIFSHIFLLHLFYSERCSGQYVTATTPTITDVSAMCSSEGITASILFDGPFSGKIYSLDYATVHDCVYYSGQDLDNVLFSIPVHRCGTRLSRTSRNMVDQMENRIYVQMEREAQTAADRQFLFVCQLADAKAEESSIRRHPVVPSSGSGSYAMAPKAVKNGHIHVITHVQPIKGVSIPRVSAFSTDKHFGNWPIPGAHPYSPSVTPVASWPRLPLPEPIIPQDQSEQQTPITALPAFGRNMDEYVVSPARDPITRAPPNPFISAGSAIIPTMIGAHSAEKFDMGLQPVRTITYSPGVLRSLTVSQVTSMPAEPKTDHYAKPEISRTRVKTEQKGMEADMPLQKKPATKIPAYPWNKPYPGSYLSEVTTASMNQSTYENSYQAAGRHWDKARIYKEEQPRIGVEFKTDADHKVMSNDNSAVSRLISTQEYLAPPAELSLEIQQGTGPFAPAVNSLIKIGDNITLVVRSKSQMKGEDDYDMFVHSCFASDGQGNTKIDLIDENGCVSRPQFVSQLNRTKDPSGMMYYFFQITAFKFPGPDDVYFSCSIEMTPFRNAQEICPVNRRSIREVTPENELRLFDSIKVELAEQIENSEHFRNSPDSTNSVSMSKSLLALIATVFCTLLISTVVVSFLAISFYLRLAEQHEKTLYTMYSSQSGP